MNAATIARAGRARIHPSVGLVLLLLGLFGCAGLGGPVRPTEEERGAYERALGAGQTAPADEREALEAFVAAHPEGALVADARLRLADLALAEGDEAEALAQWQAVVASDARRPAVDVARVRLAEREIARGRPDAARAALSRLRLSQLDGADRAAAYRVLAEVAIDPVERVRWLTLLRGAAEDPAEQERVDGAIDLALEGLPDADLERLTRLLGDEPPIARVWLVRAERALAAGDAGAAEEALARAGALPLPPRQAPRLANARERLRLLSTAPSDAAALPTFADVSSLVPPSLADAEGTLGVALPLSGPYAQFGEESLEGVLLAAGIFGPQSDAAPREGRLRVLVRDTAGDPSRAAAAVRDLASEGVVAIVGPLLSAESEAAAGAAQELGVPLLALTSREEIAHLRSYVFRLRTRPVEEAQVLVDKARGLGAERFAILYRDDPYGRGLRALFWDAVEARGGNVTAVASYDPELTDFAEPIRRLVGYVLLDDEQRRMIGRREAMIERARRLPAAEARAVRYEARSLTTADGRPIPPIVDFDALFIADSFEKVVLIAPQLAFHEAVGARLLGPDGWYDPELVALGKEHVEGAVFVAHYYSESPTPYVHAFADRFALTFDHTSNEFAAQAYDAASLVLAQLVQGRDSRDEVRDGVLETRLWPGVSGVMRMQPDGNAEKRPFLLGVERGEIVQYD